MRKTIRTLSQSCRASYGGIWSSLDNKCYVYYYFDKIWYMVDQDDTAILVNPDPSPFWSSYKQLDWQVVGSDPTLSDLPESITLLVHSSRNPEIAQYCKLGLLNSNHVAIDLSMDANSAEFNTKLTLFIVFMLLCLFLFLVLIRFMSKYELYLDKSRSKSLRISPEFTPIRHKSSNVGKKFDDDSAAVEE